MPEPQGALSGMTVPGATGSGDLPGGEPSERGVETMGFEPTTLGLQSRCSAN